MEVSKDSGQTMRALSQLQDKDHNTNKGNSMGTPPYEASGARPKETQMWKKYTAGASSAAAGGISEWFPPAYGGGADLSMRNA